MPVRLVFRAAIFGLALASLCGQAQAARPDEPVPSPSPKGAATPASLKTSPSPSPSPSATARPAYANMEWREIGPALPGGRVASVAGSSDNPKLYVLGSAGGGVWKSTDGAETWQPVFEKEKVSAIGAVAIDPKNDDVIWAGTGESNPRNDVSWGNGVYKSTDGGKTWKHLGLVATKTISRILIDPRDSNHVIVGALGDNFAPNENRGVYVTEDGGTTWTKSLYVSDVSGASDLAMDVTHPNVVYAGMWHFQRKPWTFTSGGEDDGLYRSADGGRTWNRLSGHGLPEGITGRIGLAVAPSDGNRVYALIEASKGILWRSDNAGADWQLVSSDSLVDQRPFYFSHVSVDPKNPDRVYAVSEALSVSTDAGKKFSEIARQVHVDYHAIWIAPNDPNRIIIGADGGIARTVDGGSNWFYGRNLPVGEVYHVGLGNENPYTICGGWQDNSGWCGPSNSLDSSGILNRHWTQSTGGDGEWSVVDPIDPNWLWQDSENGSVSVYNKATKDAISAQPYLQSSLEAYDLSKSKYRFNWDSPIAFAPWNGHIAWFGGNVIFQTTDRGLNWKRISPDLTRNEKSHQQPSGGPITHDVSGAEYSDTILDIEGSTRNAGEIWVGTDDGLVQLTRDGGKHWKNVTPPGVREFGRVETAAPSAVVSGTAYVNIERHYSGDNKPYVFVTHNYGQTWTSISNGLPADQPVRAVRPDLHNANVVYAGTEMGMWISVDGGASWADFKNNLPTVAVYDIRYQPQFNDLAIATHGRALYIMDDMRPVQQLAGGIPIASVIAPRTAYQYTLHSDDEGTYTDYVGQNPPYGAMVYFYQKSPAKTPPVIRILDASGHAIRTIEGERKSPTGGRSTPYVTNKAGLNRYVWDFQTDGPVKWTGAAKPRYQGANEGPAVPPGRYSVRTSIGGRSFTKSFTVAADPRSTFTQAQYQAAYVFDKKYFHEFSVVDTMLNTLDSVKRQLDAAAASPKAKADANLGAHIASVDEARKTLFDTLTADYQNDEDSIQRPGKLREDLQGLSYNGAPITPPMYEIAHRINADYTNAIARFNAFVKTTVPGLDPALKAAGLTAITGATPVSP